MFEVAGLLVPPTPYPHPLSPQAGLKPEELILGKGSDEVILQKRSDEVIISKGSDKVILGKRYDEVIISKVSDKGIIGNRSHEIILGNGSNKVIPTTQIKSISSLLISL